MITLMLAMRYFERTCLACTVAWVIETVDDKLSLALSFVFIQAWCILVELQRPRKGVIP